MVKEVVVTYFKVTRNIFYGENIEKSLDSPYWGRDSNPDTPEYEAWDLITQQQCLVVYTYIILRPSWMQ